MDKKNYLLLCGISRKLSMQLSEERRYTTSHLHNQSLLIEVNVSFDVTSAPCATYRKKRTGAPQRCVVMVILANALTGTKLLEGRYYSKLRTSVQSGAAPFTHRGSLNTDHVLDMHVLLMSDVCHLDGSWGAQS
jgi:hypothetical protein